MKGYKGFSKGLICRGKQYAENTVFEEDNAEICHSGMHFCKNPFDVLDHYGFVNDNGKLNEFCEVEALDDVQTDDENGNGMMMKANITLRVSKRIRLTER